MKRMDKIELRLPVNLVLNLPNLLQNNLQFFSNFKFLWVYECFYSLFTADQT